MYKLRMKRMSRLSTHLRSSHVARLAAGAGLLLVVIVACLDWVTGPNLDFSLFYLIPVCFVTWYAGQRWGYVVSVICAASWLCVDWLTGVRPATSLLELWNVLMR